MRRRLSVAGRPRVGDDCDSSSKEAMRRLVMEGGDLIGMRVGIEVVRVWRGRSCWRSLSGDKGGSGGGAMDVGVVEAMGLAGVEE